MSRTFDAPRWGRIVGAAGVFALLLSALAALCLTTRADAAFTTGKCAGADVIGRGASFARDAHKVFNFNFANNYCIGTPGFGSINVTYESQGSGAGMEAVINRGLPPRFGMSDDPPDASQMAQMNAGTLTPGSDPIATDNGKIHVVPAAVGAVAPLVNFPDDCDPTKLPAAARTDSVDSTADDNLIRVRFTKDQFEKAWAKDPSGDEWDEVFPALAGGACVDEPIIRVVRFDKSGTTYAFKDYLNAINPARKWLQDFTGDNREWPSATFGSGGQCGGTAAPGNQPDATDHLTSGCASGNDDLTVKLVDTDGSIGYSDLSTARNNSPSLAVDASDDEAPFDNDVYWTQIQNGSNQFTEPTADPNGFRTDGLKGSNCQAATFSNVPGATTEDWSKVSGVDAPSGYGICTMTYGLVFDDNSDVWGSSTEEESKARTVKDYWLNALSDGAQGQLFANDYAPLPEAIQALALDGVESIDWQKGEGGGGEEEQPRPQPQVTKPVDSAPIVVAPPSNAFSVTKKAISSKNGKATISLKLPGPGKVVMVGKAKNGKKTINVGKVTLNAAKAGTFNLTLNPSGAAKKVLKKKGSLRVNLEIAFTPTGGSAKSSKTAVTLKLKKNKK